MKSIRLKLWTSMMTIVIIALVLLWFFQIVFIEEFYTDMKITEIKSHGYSIIEELEYVDSAEIKNELDEFSYNHNLSIEVFDTKGNTVYESTRGAGGNTPMMLNNVRNKALKEVLDNKEFASTLTHNRFGNKLMLVGIPIKISNHVQGAFFMHIPLAPVEDTVSLLKKQLIYITAILLIVVSIISFVISKTFTKPILEINRVSEKIASGDFSDKIFSEGKDEIGKLAETINYMGQELSKIDKLRKEFISNVSHELRTPLSIIRGYAETIRDVNGNITEKREKHLEIIIDETERLSGIVDDALNLSQLQAGYMNLCKSSFDFRDLIEQVLKRYEVIIQKASIRIDVMCTEDILIKADRARIEQVLYNLINNAINHTPKGGEVNLRLSHKNDSVRIEVEDNGTGISEENMKYIWDRYYVVDKDRERKLIGTGLGLAIVKSILEAHGALYGVESIRDLGTKFWFEIKQ